MCTHCDSKIIKSLTYQVHELRGKILDSHWVAGYFKKGQCPGQTGSTGGYKPVQFNYPHLEIRQDGRSVEMNRVKHSGVPSSTRAICSVPMSFSSAMGCL